MASSLMHIIMNYLKISRKPPCFVTVYITADYLYTEPNTSNERSQFITNRNLYELLLSKFYFISLTSSPFHSEVRLLPGRLL